MILPVEPKQCQQRQRALIDIQLIYVGTNDYLTDFRKPNHGSETLFYINNPLVTGPKYPLLAKVYEVWQEQME